MADTGTRPVLPTPEQVRNLSAADAAQLARNMNPERGDRSAGRIRPGHPAYDRIRAAIQRNGFASTRQIHNETGLAMATLGRYMRNLADGGHVVSQPNGIGRGYWWTWVGETAPAAPEVDATPDNTGTDPNVDASTLPAVRLTLAPASEDGHAQGPFVVTRFGAITDQARWQGMPLTVVGFIDGDGRQIGLWWGDYVDAADWGRAVGLYPVTENRDGDWAKQLTVVASAEVFEAVPDAS